MRIDEIENLVFQGGSVKGIAYLGALEELERGTNDNNNNNTQNALTNLFSLKKMKRIAGTSAGAITATLVALGYPLDALKKEQEELDFRELLDEKSGNTRRFFFQSVNNSQANTSKTSKVAKSTSNVVSHPIAASQISSRLSKDMGIYDGEFLRKWLEQHIYIRTGDKHLTFLELHKMHLKKPEVFKDLFVVGANLSTGLAEAFNYLKTPNVIIADAVRISLSIPLLFKPHTVYIKNAKGERELAKPSYVYTDGGILDNYPINALDFAGFVDNLQEDDPKFWEPKFNSKTLGLRLVSSQKKAFLEGSTEAPATDIMGLLPYFKALMHTIMNKQDSDHRLREDKIRTIYIDNQNVDTLAFDLSAEEKEKLIQAGKDAVKQWFEQEQEVENERVIPENLPAKFF